jgi:hypothetical protein
VKEDRSGPSGESVSQRLGNTLAGVDFADPVHQRVMRALTATGHYDETPDSFEWQAYEASDIAYFVHAGFPDLEGEVYALLADTGLHDPSQPDEDRCLRNDAANIARACNID